MRRILIVSGGMIEEDFALEFLKGQPPFDDIIAADKGAAFCLRAGLCPALLVGDFDTLPGETLELFRREQIPIRQFRPEKDFTDMEIALSAAMEYLRTSGGGEGRAVILGGTGTRLDHVLGTLYAVAGVRKELDCEIVDSHNRIRMLLPGEYTIRREELYGKYVSFLPIGGEAQGVTLQGFRYPVQNAVLTPWNSLGVSNELAGDVGTVAFTGGRLAFFQTRD